MDRIVSPLVIQRTAAEWATQDPFLARGDLGAESDTGREKIGVGLKWSDTPYKPVGPIFKLKLADQTLASSTTLTDDDTLFFTAEANSTYAVSLSLLVHGSGTLTGIVGKMTGPGGATFYGQWVYVHYDATGYDTIFANGEPINNPQDPLSNSSSVCTLLQSFVVKTGAGGGTVKFQFAQASPSVNNVTVYAGSFLKAEKVA